jgi:hypothetical protein
MVDLWLQVFWAFRSRDAPRIRRFIHFRATWHEIGYKKRARAAWENFLERGKAGGGLGIPVLRTFVDPSSPTAALLPFSALWCQKTFAIRRRGAPTGHVSTLWQLRENHANARKISHRLLGSEGKPAGDFRLAG